MSLQVECSAEESVTIRTMKRLKDCINVAHVTYMIIVSQQSDSVVIFLHTSSSKFSDNVSIYNINVVKQNRILTVSRFSIIGILFMWTRFRLNQLGLSPSILFIKEMKSLDVFSSRLFPCKCRPRARKRHRLSFFGCLVLSSM